MDELPTRRSLRDQRVIPTATRAGRPAAPARTRSRLGNILHAVGVGLSTGLLLLMLGLAVVVIALPIAVGGNAYTVLTGSMRPSLPPGTLLIVKPAPVSEIGVGDVITYQLESGRPEVVTHRVVARTSNPSTGEVTFVTRGDANSNDDPVPVREVQIRGKVWYAIPLIGWVNNVLGGESRAWLVPLIAGLLFAYAGWMFASGIRDRRRGRATMPAEQSAGHPAEPAPDIRP